ncbi:enamine deaminase RidA (YjgF/YER057c/UK114 family) [Humitalea rosea]|uniref:Enamine deaminase RidA (YjgF/YER057c/UK114 family) n=1 Tax=Humitalea rosea TaxID=990373 RepID=A0A2W7KR41_9PROT|nr:RidA family protein [Humitalea rosea]PZW51040.1 enamine deaminase RidA (YjgF/YER057c/UK114 family) [Humitalea rosea]
MSKISRNGSNKILSSSVEYHGFVYLAGLTADDLSQDIAGQTTQVLAKIDAQLELHGTDNTRLLQAQIWLKDIRDRDAMNKLWSAWLPEGGAPVRACVEANMADPRHLVEIMVTACK